MEPLVLDPPRTSRLVYDDLPRMLAWARRGIPGSEWEADAKAIGREVNGELVAVTVYERFTDGDCHTHLCSDGSRRWMTRQFITHSYAYPFIQMRQRRVTGLVPETNHRAIRLNTHMGFQIEGRIREAMPDGTDLIVMGMLRRECRWIPESYRHG